MALVRADAMFKLYPEKAVYKVVESMTESEAIKWQKEIGEVFKGFPLEIEEKMNVSCDKAINALEKQEKIKEAYEMWQTETGGYYGADDETTRFISALTQILRSDEE